MFWVEICCLSNIFAVQASAAESEEERRKLEETWIFDDFDEVDYT